MSPASAGQVVNLLAFLTGAVLYAMLIGLVVHGARVGGRHWWSARERLPLLTGAAGLLWNLGGLLPPDPLMQTLGFAALGTLPAFIVHSLFQGGERSAGRSTQVIVPAIAYTLSGGAALLNLVSAWRGAPVPSNPSVWMLTIGFTLLTAIVLLVTRGRPVGRRGIWVAALSIFAVSSLHFDQHNPGTAWWTELLLHHASIPLALAILHQDYRFAFVDLFLKHALALVTTIAVSATVFSLAIVPLIRDGGVSPTPQSAALAVLLWAATAALFPMLPRAINRLVDRIVLRRPDYTHTIATLERALQDAEDTDAVQRALAQTLRNALYAEGVTWMDDPVPASVRRTVISGPATRAYGSECVALLRPDTVSDPQVAIRLDTLAEGRRLLSDDLGLLEQVTRLIARRLDALRVADERLAASMREQQMQRLATEAELRALRAQINPHFLFNALTTVGYLIQTAPDRALTTLLKLTGVLRGVLRQSQVEFVPLRDELTLVRAYLDIEIARFEDRLVVTEDVAPDVLDIVVPPFILQPIVENAIKHGIAPLRDGGTVRVVAQREGELLRLEVMDSGAGTTAAHAGHRSGVGLQNIERRLDAHFGRRASLVIDSAPGRGTTVCITLPIH